MDASLLLCLEIYFSIEGANTTKRRMVVSSLVVSWNWDVPCRVINCRILKFFSSALELGFTLRGNKLLNIKGKDDNGNKIRL